MSMTVERYRNIRIDLAETYDLVQRKSQRLQEEEEGWKLLRQLDDEERLRTGDQSASTTDARTRTGDQSIRTGDQSTRTEDQSTRTGDQSSRTGGQSARTGDQSVCSTDSSYHPSEPEEPPSPSRRPYSYYNKDDLPMVALVKMHHGISNRAVSELLTAYQLDMGRKDGTWDQSKIVDHNKIFRACKQTSRKMVDMRNRELATTTFNGGLYYDGKQELTLVPKDIAKDGGRATVKKTEDHYVLLEQPGDYYICHLAAQSPEEESEERKAEIVAKQILQELRTRGVDVSTITALGCDGTPLNTGCRGGINIWIEKELGQRLNWIVCLIHTLELGPRALMSDLDGSTNSATSYKGPIGLLLPSVEHLTRNPNFVPIQLGDDIEDLEENIEQELSTDFKHLRLLVKAIRTGIIPEVLYSVTLGPVCHSRWYTTVNRLCLLYMSHYDDVLNDESKEVLKLLIEFIVCLYAPMSFLIKKYHHWLNAPNLYCKMIRMMRLLHPRNQNVLRQTWQRGAYCLHPEYLLQSMLWSKELDLRKKAVKIILAIRQGSDKGDSSFQTRHNGERLNPPVNWLADSIEDIILWEQVDKQCLEPPLSCPISTEDLKKFATPEHKMQVPEFPVHSQAVERAIKRLSSVSCEVCRGFLYNLIFTIHLIGL